MIKKNRPRAVLFFVITPKTFIHTRIKNGIQRVIGGYDATIQLLNFHCRKIKRMNDRT
jgi:hypothetical protein